VTNSSDITVTKTIVGEDTVLKIELIPGQTSSTNRSIRFNHPDPQVQGGSFMANQILVVGGGGAGGFATSNTVYVPRGGGGGGGHAANYGTTLIGFGIDHSFAVGAGGQNSRTFFSVVPAGITSFTIAGPQVISMPAGGGGFGASNLANSQTGTSIAEGSFFGGGGGGSGGSGGGVSNNNGGLNVQNGSSGGSVLFANWSPDTFIASAGGGGAGGVGQSVTMTGRDIIAGGNGGPGLPSDITGTVVYYGGGGGGGGAQRSNDFSIPVVNGVGNGGGGAFGQPGTNGLGGGGGGSGEQLDGIGSLPPPGGNGVIIIRYKTLL
jgi:hypothetical protein